MWDLLVFTALFFLVSGLDDLFFDIYYWSSAFFRLFYLRKAKRLTYETLAKLPEKRIAVMIPCWHEAGVIELMLKYNIYAIDYKNYDLFVGVYPNDPETIKSVESIAELIPHVKCVIGDAPGPTNKASNLNLIYEYVIEREKKNNIQYDIFVLHDSEDIIHEFSFKLYNYLMPKNAMVQIPVFPLAEDLNQFVHWTYAAEFSEIHIKDMHVRERIGGLVPSAGVGTAFSREAIEVLKESRNGVPFSTTTLTEDYSTALQIRLHGLREIFVSQTINRTVWRKRWYFFGAPVARPEKEYIATRALFPMSYDKAVRQKTRWILGISFQEWINTGWQGNIATLYTLMHDRKTLFTHLISGLFIILIPFWLIYSYWIRSYPQYPTLQDMFDQYPWVWTVIIISSILMLNRIVQRMITVFRVYGFFPALLSVPLILYANVINLHSLLRAYSNFIFVPKKSNGKIKWDKTDHTFPAISALLTYKAKIGEVLIQHGLLTQDELVTALNRQARTGEQLGNVLVALHYVTEEQLRNALAEQYDLKIIPKKEIVPLHRDKLPKITARTYDWLLQKKSIPIDLQQDQVTIAITDPSNEILLEDIIKQITPYSVKFALIGR